MATQPRFSVCLPNFKGSHYVDEASIPNNINKCDESSLKTNPKKYFLGFLLIAICYALLFAKDAE
jgi:hypothetical protein